MVTFAHIRSWWLEGKPKNQTNKINKVTIGGIHEALSPPCLSYQNKGTNFLFWQGKFLKYPHLCVVLMCILLSDLHNTHITRPIPLVKTSGSLITLIQIELQCQIDFLRNEITTEKKLFALSVQIILINCTIP